MFFRAIVLLVPVEFVCEACVCGSQESTCSQCEGNHFVDRIICLSFLGASFVLAFFGGGRIEVVSGKTSPSASSER